MPGWASQWGPGQCLFGRYSGGVSAVQSLVALVLRSQHETCPNLIAD